MPRGIPGSGPTARKKTEPASTPVVNNAPVREQIKQMSGHANAEEMAESLPDNTMVAPIEETPRKKRRTRAEIEAAEGMDPRLTDPHYRKAVAGMSGFGVPKIIKGGFDLTATVSQDVKWKLDDGEKETLDDFFYALGVRYGSLDPMKHWVTTALYFFGMLGTFIMSRAMQSKTNSWIKSFTGWFSGEEEKKAEKAED